MNLFSNLKISYKLGFLILATLLGFALIGVMYLNVLQFQSDAEQTTSETEAVAFGASALNIQASRTQREVEAFLSAPDDARLAQTQAALADLNAEFARFDQAAIHIIVHEDARSRSQEPASAADAPQEQTTEADHDHASTAGAPQEQATEAGEQAHAANPESSEAATGHSEHSSETSEYLSQLEVLIADFNTTFNEVATTVATLGYDENSGIHGSMRAAIHELENFLLAERENLERNAYGSENQARLVDNLAMGNLMLTLRRHEKDFIQRVDDKYLDRFTDTWGAFKEKLETSAFSSGEQENLASQLDLYFENFLALVDNTKRLQDVESRLVSDQQAIEELVTDVVAEAQVHLEEDRAENSAELTKLNQVFLAILAVTAAVVVLTVLLIGGGLFRSVRQIQNTVHQVAAGDLDARAKMQGQDELSELGQAFDNMLDERLSDLERQAQENEQLNDSVINLMDAADRLSKRDLTVVVPVSEDITGNVSDALNVMARQTASTMTEINQFASQLEQAATVVQQQGDKVAQVAASEREVVEQALQSLAQSSTTMTEMADLAESSNELANNTSDSTKRALGAVRKTVNNMNDIRNTVGETEKSIKRLGERSQEIGSIVEIIKDIAERTHTLALNAGMQAVAAGEAGRGFSVVADEVQRLAETARESTAQIATLVQSIQAESSETMATMNKTIGQVVEGSELAERSGKRMRLTQRATQNLVDAVQQIAARSQALVETNEALRDQAAQLRQSTQATEQELQGQAAQTRGMFEYLRDLVAAVRVFKLPESAISKQTAAIDEDAEVISTDKAA